MAEAQNPVPALGTARIAGRVDSVRVITTQNGKLFLTLVRMAAPDQFSHPATVELQSAERIGAQGDEVTAHVLIGGRPRRVKPLDAEKAPYTTADVSLRFLRFA